MPKIVALACVLALFIGTAISILKTSKNTQSTNYARFEDENTSEQRLIGNKKKLSENVADLDRHPGEIIEELPRSKRLKVAENNKTAAVDTKELIKEKTEIKTNPNASDTVKSDQLSEQKSTGNTYLIFNKPETPLVRWTNNKSMSQADQLPSELLERKFSVYFKPDSTDITGEDIKTLAEIAGFISQDTNISVIVEGYTDSYGNRLYNQKLSQLRANMVKSYLVGHGIDISRIRAIGLGSANPIADDENEKGRSRNRRVEIKLQPMNKGSEGTDRQNE